MLHRLALRVLPQLSLTVTEPEIRTRKRWVMFVVGFVAFAAYRLAKQVVPLSEPTVLLACAAVVGAVTAALSYAIGRRVGPGHLLQVETPRRWAWLLGWVGAVYGVQLALLVLALLQITVGYDFLQHPDGPAMMAIIIPSTAVSRDAVEIGHLRWMESQGRSFLTFPDGSSLRALLMSAPRLLLGWAALGFLLSGLLTWMASHVTIVGASALAQLLVATALAAAVALCAYLAGLSAPAPWFVRWRQSQWFELAKFWWWPGLAFAATYLLVLYGAAVFLLRWAPLSTSQFMVMSGAVGALMAGYCYYLGVRRAFEDRIQSQVPASVLRCPFVTGLLAMQVGGGKKPPMPPELVAVPDTHKPVAVEQS